MIRITESANGVVISVRAQPGARRTAIVGVHDEALKVAVQAPPVDGKANAALEEALAEWLGGRWSVGVAVASMESRCPLMAQALQSW